MKKLLLLIGIATVITACCSSPKKTAQHQHPKLDTSAVMPILGWYSIPADSTSVDRLLELKESGITHHFSHYPDTAAMKKALDLAEQTGIKVIISCPELYNDPENTVRQFMNHPALAGYFLRDEPSTEQFPELGQWARKIQSVDSSHFCYLNLFPNYAPIEVLKAKSYRDYVNRFIQEVPLQLLSFDHYPVVNDTLRPEWYENLEIFSDEARKAGKPFWAFALTTSHDPYPIPTMAHLRLQVYSDLAYGAQGIQYFTYWTPGKNDVWNFHHGPIGLDGKRTDAYDKIKTMNEEIKALTPVFLGAKVLSVHHTGKAIPQGTTPLEKLPDGIKRLETNGTGAIVSELLNGDKKFIVIVNRDLHHPLELQIEPDPSFKRILKDGSIIPASLYSDTLNIEPGDAMIFMQ